MTAAHDAEKRIIMNNRLDQVLPRDGIGWWKKPCLVRLNFCILSILLLSSAGGYDGSMMNGLQALPQWKSFMDEPTGSWLGFVNAVYWLGMGLGFPVATLVSNNFGRKPGLYAGYMFVIMGIAMQTAAGNKAAFIAARFLVGVAAAWYVPILINETAYPTHRGIASALYMCGFHVGAVLAAWVTFAYRDSTGAWGWRLPSLLQILCPLVAFPGLYLSTDSPRWLISKGRVDEARSIICDSHAGGDQSSPLVDFEMMEIEAAIKAEREAHDSASYLDMFKTPGKRRRLVITITLGFFSQWVGNGVVSYYLALMLDTVGVKSTTDQLLISAFLQLWNVMCAVVAAVSVDRVGRRRLFLASGAIMFASYVIITGLSGSFAQSGSGATGIAVIPFLFIFFMGYDIALTPLVVAYPCEIWHFSLRSRGVTVAWISAIVAIFFNTFVNPIALAALGWKYYIVFVVVVILYCLTAYFLYPETKGYTLEEMAVIFDGESAHATLDRTTKMTAVAISHVEKGAGYKVAVNEQAQG